MKKTCPKWRKKEKNELVKILHQRQWCWAQPI